MVFVARLMNTAVGRAGGLAPSSGGLWLTPGPSCRPPGADFPRPCAWRFANMRWAACLGTLFFVLLLFCCLDSCSISAAGSRCLEHGAERLTNISRTGGSAIFGGHAVLAVGLLPSILVAGTCGPD